MNGFTPERRLLSLALSAMDWLHENGDAGKIWEIRDEIRMYFRGADKGPPDMSWAELNPRAAAACEQEEQDRSDWGDNEGLGDQD